ncbi:sialate O-acetylesterase [Mucilaginibacter sp.]|uniref:sialate O-acetylesterase n=1 Tax=Mucilaginibacter sp. TaxID=1882438 RepID=UPI0035677DB7
MFVCLFVSAQDKPDPNFHLYILIGQSNMAGRGVISDEFKNQGNPNLYMLDKQNQWVTAKNPLHFDKPKIVGVGPGMMFGIRMAETDPKSKIGLIPCAVGGTAIDAWEPGGYDKATNTHPYDDAVIRIKEAMKFGVIKGVIWHQGEANSTAEQSKTHLNQLTALIERVRELTKKPDLPFVVGELGRYRADYQYINHELARLPATVKVTAVASSEGLVDKGDQTHFDSPSANEMGKRMADKMIKLQKN